MRITPSQVRTHVLTILFALGLLLIARESHAQAKEEAPNDGKVDVGYSAQIQSTSRQRRGESSVIFGLNVDNIKLTKFRSKLDDADYSEIFGTDTIPLVQGEFGWKYNFLLGGISASLLYGRGSVTGRPNGFFSTLTLSKMGAGATYVMDNLFPDPYVAPYISGQIYSFNWEETADTLDSKSGTTTIGTAFQAGFLFQLNWLDPASTLDAYNSSGLNNSYLDVFISQYLASDGPTDPNFESDLNVGFGVKLEF